MSFLFPAMLAGLASLSVPIILHLIARQRFPVLDFPSIRLLQREDRTNVFAWKLVDVWQLLLRLLVLFLLVLAMSRLFVSWHSASPAARNLVLVMDCSASMRMLASDAATGERAALIDLAKGRGRELLREIKPPSQCALVVAGESIRAGVLGPSPESAVKELEGLEATDGTGAGVVAAIASGCSLVSGRREIRSQVVVLTDVRASAFAIRNPRDLERIRTARSQLGEKLDIVLVDFSEGLDENLAIQEARVRGERVQVGHDAHVIARVLNSSGKEKSTKVRLAVGDRDEPAARIIILPPGSEAHVEMTSRVDRAVQTFAQVRLQDEDALAHDNAWSVPLEVADVRRVLLVDGSLEEAATPQAAQIAALGGSAQEITQPESEESASGGLILRYALNPGRELGLASGTGIHTTTVTPDALAGQPLSKYEVIILYNVSSLPEPMLEDLDTFLRQGRSLLFFCSASCNAVKFNRCFAAAGGKRGILCPARLGNERECIPPLSIQMAGSTSPVLAAFRDPLQGDLSVIRFMKVRDLSGLADGASVLLSAAGGTPLAVEMSVERGRAVLLGFGLDLNYTNLTRTRVFPALMWRLIDDLTGHLRKRPPHVLHASTSGVLDVSDPAFGLVNSLELSPADRGREEEASKAAAPLLLPVSADRTALTPGLPSGRYLLHKPRPPGDVAARISYSRPVTVNPDPRESRMERIEQADLADLFGSGVRKVSRNEALDLSPRGNELWKSLVLLLILVYAAEAAIGWWLSVLREKERSAT